MSLLILLLLIPLIGLIELAWLSYNKSVADDEKKYLLEAKSRVLLNSFISFIFTLFIYINYNFVEFGYQYVNGPESYRSWLSLTLIDSQTSIWYHVGADGISISFLLLTTFIIPICVLVSWNVNYFTIHHLSLFLFIEFLLIIIFTCLNIFYFYIFFEAILIPMFLLIGFWGSRERRIKAAYYFFLYTFFGSLFMFLGLISIHLEVGSLDLSKLIFYDFSLERQQILWLSFFIAFAVKIPMFPWHIWLPEAHVEAPTTGSILLAALLLKLGGYGFIRFTLPIFPLACEYYLPLIYVMSLLGIGYASMTTLIQIDLKRIIAYSSIAHMNFVLLGIFSRTYEGIEGGILLMMGHGFVSTGLFFLVGILYNRYKERLLYYFGGITQVMPIFSIFFLFFSLANLSFPGTSNFVGEFLILSGVIQKSTVVLLLAGFGMILSACYSIWLYNRVAFGELNIYYLKKFKDISKLDIWILIWLIFWILLIGIYPILFFDLLHYSVIGNLKIYSIG